MKTCRKCTRQISDNAKFCPYCGEKFDVEKPQENAVTSHNEISKTKKQMSTGKKVAAIISSGIVIILFLTVAFCEVKISKAKSLYSQGEYVKARSQVYHIPSLGRETVIRIKTAGLAGNYYSLYLTTKRIRISSQETVYDDAYQDAFFDLIFGLYIDLKWIQSDNLNDIEIDEYQKFIDFFYNELDSMFSVSKSEADQLVEEFRQVDEVSDMHDIANGWLDENFFR